MPISRGSEQAAPVPAPRRDGGRSAPLCPRALPSCRRELGVPGEAVGEGCPPGPAQLLAVLPAHRSLGAPQRVITGTKPASVAL